MSYKVYTERYIRTKIISKAQPVIKKSRSPHDIGKIMVDGKPNQEPKVEVVYHTSGHIWGIRPEI